MTSRLGVQALPGALFLAYLVTTAVLFFIGPWRFPVADGGKLVAFLVAVHLAFALGYFVGLKRPGRESRWHFDVGRVATLCLLVDVVLLFPTSAFNTGSWIPNPWAALGHLGDAYLESLRLRDGAVPWVNYLRILVAPLLASAWPLGVVYWQRLRVAGRVLLVASVVGTVALYVAMGANMGAAHWMALFPWFVLAGVFSGTLRLGRPGWLAAGAIGVASLALFALFFTATMNQRHGSFARYGHLPGIEADLRDAGPAEATADEPTERDTTERDTTPQSPSVAEPSPAAVGARGLAGYLTQGYYAVYLSLEEPFVPGWGVGHSVFLQRQAARLTGNPAFLERSYPQRIEARGWNAYTYWATVYPWIASDVTFPGTVVVVFLVAWAFAAVWKDVLTGANPFAVAFFGQLLLMLYYFPAHNRTMQSGEGVVAFTVLGGLWLLGPRREVALSNRGERTTPPGVAGVASPPRPATPPAIGAGASSPEDVASAVVGSLLPDRPEFRGQAYSPAGQMFQRELLKGLAAAGLLVGTVFSFRCLPAFPRSRALWVAGGAEDVDGMNVRFLPFVNVHPLKSLTAGVSLLVALLAWRWRNRDVRQRLIHCINVHMPPGLITLLAARLTGSRITASVLEVFLPGVNVPDRWRWHLDLLLQRHAIRRLDAVMVVSPAIARDLTHRQPVCHVEGGIGEQALVPLVRQPRPASAPFTAAFAGSLEPINCIRWMLDTMELLPADGYRLLVAGDGSLAAEVSERSARDPRVEYRGLLDFEGVREMYAEADALLCIRRTDQRQQYFFPSKLMEYLASGVPVVCTAIAGVDPDLEGAMVLLRDETPAGLAALLRELAAMAPEERQALGRRARQLVLRDKTWAAQGQKLAAFLLGVARSG